MLLQYTNAVHKVQKRLVAAFELIVVVHGFKITPCAARGVNKVGHWTALC